MVLVLILLLFYVLMSLSASSTLFPETLSSVVRETSTNLSNDSSKNSNDVDSIKIQYPSGWDRFESNGKIMFYPRSNTSADHFQRFMVSTDKVPSDIRSSPGPSLEEFVESNKNELNISNFQTLSYDSIIRKGFPIEKIVFVATQGDNELKGESIFIVKAKTIYKLLYLTEASEYYKNLPIAYKMIDSFIDMTIKKEYPEFAGINVGSHPRGIAINPITNILYVANSLSNTISVIDANTDHLVKNIKVGTTPQSVAINPMDNRIYVVNRGSDTVSVIDGTTNDIVGTVRVGKDPQGIAVDAIGTVYIANWFAANVSYFNDAVDDPPNGTANTISVGNQPNAVAADFYSKQTPVYVTDSNGISVIKSFLIEETVQIPLAETSSSALAVDPTSNRIFVANQNVNSHIISAFEESRSGDDLVYNEIGRTEVEGNPDNLAYNPNTNMLYVSYTGFSNISVIDTGTNDIVDNIVVGNSNLDEDLFTLVSNTLAINPATNLVYIVNEGSGKMYILEGSSNNVTVGVTIKVSPPNSGRIECDEKTNIQDGDYVRLNFGINKCVAKANDGFTFNSWAGDVKFSDSNNDHTIVGLSEYGKEITVNFRETLPKEYFEALNNIIYIIIIPAVASMARSIFRRSYIK